MTDPLARVVALLAPRATFSKLVLAGGAWAVRRADDARPFYCAVLEGACRLTVDGQAPRRLGAGDFVLAPAGCDVTTGSMEPAAPGPTARIALGPGVFRLGPTDQDPDVRLLIGHCAFASDDAALLVSLLPRLVHVRGEGRLATLGLLLDQEIRGERPGREAVLARLLEVLLIEALRATAHPDAPPGLLRGLADPRLARALRALHEEPARPWTAALLAQEAALSRSAFCARFRHEVGVAPMAYLLGWRMALARDLLRRDGARVEAVAAAVGYGGASTFSVAFARHAGMPPARYARAAPAA